MTASGVVWPDVGGRVQAVGFDGASSWAQQAITHPRAFVFLTADSAGSTFCITEKGGHVYSATGAELFTWSSPGFPRGIAIGFGETAIVTTDSGMVEIQSIQCAI